MAKSFQQKIETMSHEELEKLKADLFQEIVDNKANSSWKSLASLNMSTQAIGRKIMRVAALLYPLDSEEFQACKKQVFGLMPHYHKLTEAEKNEKVINVIEGELTVINERRTISRIPRKLGYRTHYAKREKEWD